jgi:hypothetical protein
VYPISHDKLHGKLLFKKGQVRNVGSFILRLNMYFEIREGFLCLVFFLMRRSATGASLKHTHVSTDSARENALIYVGVVL